MENLVGLILMVAYILIICALLYGSVSGRRLKFTGVKMFTRQSKYDSLMHAFIDMSSRAIRLEVEISSLRSQLAMIRAPGTDSSGFTPAEIDRMIRLCHPSKHNDSEASNEITKKLLQMRTKKK